jgi:hypothetical protein
MRHSVSLLHSTFSPLSPITSFSLLSPSHTSSSISTCTPPPITLFLRQLAPRGRSPPVCLTATRPRAFLPAPPIMHHSALLPIHLTTAVSYLKRHRAHISKVFADVYCVAPWVGAPPPAPPRFRLHAVTQCAVVVYRGLYVVLRFTAFTGERCDRLQPLNHPLPHQVRGGRGCPTQWAWYQ